MRCSIDNPGAAARARASRPTKSAAPSRFSCSSSWTRSNACSWGEGVLPEGYDFEAHRELVPIQPGDVVETYADCSELERDFGYRPATRLEDGLRAFARRCRGYYGL